LLFPLNLLIDLLLGLVNQFVLLDDLCLHFEVLLLLEGVCGAFDNLHAQVLFEGLLLVLLDLELIHSLQAALDVPIPIVDLLLQLLLPESLLLVDPLPLLLPDPVFQFGALQLLQLFLFLFRSDTFECFIVRRDALLDLQIVTLLHS